MQNPETMMDGTRLTAEEARTLSSLLRAAEDVAKVLASDEKRRQGSRRGGQKTQRKYAEALTRTA